VKKLCLLSLLFFVGCIKPYDVPEFAEIQNHETVYVIPVNGANKNTQGKFESEKYLEEKKVAFKRIQIPHIWVKTGRLFPSAGYYQDTVRVVVVNRSPVTREWTADKDTGTTNGNQAIWLESRDSIGFSLGFNSTAFIPEEDTSKFLYYYPTTVPDDTMKNVDKSTASLAHVMDTEVRARVQMLANTIAAKYELDDLRAKKAEILAAVRNGIPEQKDSNGNIIQENLTGTIEHFAQRGIKITNLGQFGGFEYEEPKIQDAINETFVAQQEKVRTEAAFEAQQKKNDRVELEAKAQANKAREVALGEADAIKTLADAKAASIKSVAEATKQAGQDPLFLKLKQLEVESERIEKWDGKYPNTLMNLGREGAPNVLLNVPTPTE